jgi:hypothetical protein
VADSSVDPVDLLDLKLLPAWVKEPAPADRYSHIEGEELPEHRPRRDHPPRKQSRQSKRSKPVGRDNASPARTPSRRLPDRDRKHRRREDRHKAVATAAPPVQVKFLPRAPVFENVVAQIKAGLFAYSLFALARLFLEKPERYEVRLTAKTESPLHRLGEDGAVALGRAFLEQNAFRLAHRDFYKIDIGQSEPIKGNFFNVARCKLSGTLLGPTNHHGYQARLRNLYEQRFSRRMSFSDYQREIQIVSDPAMVEQWKEEARKVTTYTTQREETPSTFSSAVDAERHFRTHYLPGLIRTAEELTIGGVLSRHLPDRMLGRVIENAWARETRSPSQMMQELAGQFRQSGLNIFRHRRGMLFVSPIRPRTFVHEEAGVSPSVNAILAALAGVAALNRKLLAEKLIDGSPAEGAVAGIANDQVEQRKLALASDLHWLISEGYVIEFNDGSLDLPRGKVVKRSETARIDEKFENVGDVVAAVVPTAESTEQALDTSASTTVPELEVGGA